MKGDYRFKPRIMTKLEEISALLCLEIDEFEKAVGRLEKLNRAMKEEPIKVDSSEIERLLKEHRVEQLKNLRDREAALNGILRKLENALVFPSWALKLLGSLLIVVMLVLGYAVWEVTKMTGRI